LLCSYRGRSAGAAMLLAVLAGACARREQESLLSEPIGEPAAIQSGIGIPASAVEAIAQRRCDSALRCGQIGAGKRYNRKPDCVFQSRAEWAKEMNAVACPRGVDEARLDACLHELEAENCADVDAVRRRPDCLASVMCQSVPTPRPALPPPISYAPN